MDREIDIEIEKVESATSSLETILATVGIMCGFYVSVVAGRWIYKKYYVPLMEEANEAFKTDKAEESKVTKGIDLEFKTIVINKKNISS